MKEKMNASEVPRHDTFRYNIHLIQTSKNPRKEEKKINCLEYNKFYVNFAFCGYEILWKKIIIFLWA